MGLFSPKILVAINIATDLIKAGSDIFALLNGKKDLSEADLQQIIADHNKAQAKARDELIKLLD